MIISLEKKFYHYTKREENNKVVEEIVGIWNSAFKEEETDDRSKSET